MLAVEKPSILVPKSELALLHGIRTTTDAGERSMLIRAYFCAMEEWQFRKWNPDELTLIANHELNDLLLPVAEWEAR